MQLWTTGGEESRVSRTVLFSVGQSLPHSPGVLIFWFSCKRRIFSNIDCIVLKPLENHLTSYAVWWRGQEVYLGQKSFSWYLEQKSSLSLKLSFGGQGINCSLSIKPASTGKSLDLRAWTVGHLHSFQVNKWVNIFQVRKTLFNKKQKIPNGIAMTMIYNSNISIMVFCNWPWPGFTRLEIFSTVEKNEPKGFPVYFTSMLQGLGEGSQK